VANGPGFIALDVAGALQGFIGAASSAAIGADNVSAILPTGAKQKVPQGGDCMGLAPKLGGPGEFDQFNDVAPTLAISDGSIALNGAKTDIAGYFGSPSGQITCLGLQSIADNESALRAGALRSSPRPPPSKW
jgi:hypothetical protein